ncbi:MAG: hypothetical protein ACR2OX_00930, partial [Methyloligellaceae bacterium]
MPRHDASTRIAGASFPGGEGRPELGINWQRWFERRARLHFEQEQNGDRGVALPVVGSGSRRTADHHGFLEDAVIRI